MKILKKFLLGCLVVLLFQSNIDAFEIRDDLTIHLSVGFMIGSVVTKYMDTNYILYSEHIVSDKGKKYSIEKKEKDFWYYFIPSVSVISFGLAKELTDGKFDIKDLVYTAVGGVGGIILVSW